MNTTARRVGGKVAAVLSSLVCAAFLSAASATWAAFPGEFVTLPLPPNKPKSGIRAVVDARWVDANGYRPVRVQINTTPAVPAPADRSFDVVLDVSGWYQQVFQPTVSKTIELPEGATSAEGVLLIPQFLTWSSMSVTIYENGRELKELTYSGAISNFANNQWTEATPTVLFIDSDAPTLSQRESLVGTAVPSGTINQGMGGAAGNSPDPKLPDVRSVLATLGYGNLTLHDQGLSPVDDQTTLMYVARLQQVEMLPPAELPREWMHYTCFDTIVISFEDLRALAATSPRTLTALRRWTSTGPTLVVYDAGDRFDRLASLERLLKMPKAPAIEEPSGHRGWKAADLGLRKKPFQAPQGYSTYSGGGQWIMQNGQQVWVNNAQVAATRQTEQGEPTIYDRDSGSGKMPFVSRELGFGRVIAIADQYPFPGTVQDWQWIFHTVGENNWKWYQRHGLSLNRNNSHYWNWLIPGVGMPPVTTFLVLISVFVVVIGPINYFLLNRMRRLYLLLVTVPAGAGLITACLFLFALFSDGLGVKARIRSVTILDQASGEAVSCSRQTYYASMAPSRGLTFPDDAAVYPLELHPYNLTRSESRRRYVNWDNEQNLRTGFIRSRTQNQFMVFHPTAVEAGLRIQEPPATGGDLDVENRLGSALEHLLVADSQGRLYYAAGVSDGGTCAPASIEPEQARDNLRPVLGQARPATPQHLNVSRYDNAYRFNSNWYYNQRRNLDGDQPSPTHITSVLEAEVRKLERDEFRIPPRHYVAVVRTSPYVPVGVPRMREMASFHLVLGRW